MLNFSPKANSNRFPVKYLYKSVSWELQDEKSLQIVFKNFNAILWVTILPLLFELGLGTCQVYMCLIPISKHRRFSHFCHKRCTVDK